MNFNQIFSIQLKSIDAKNYKIFNNKRYIIELGLTEKDTASEMLVNRKTMTKLRVSIHPNRKFIVSDYAGRDDDYTRDNLVNPSS